MECPHCKEISYTHVDTEVHDGYKTLEYNCTECHGFGFFDEKLPKETVNDKLADEIEVLRGVGDLIEDLKKAVSFIENELRFTEYERDMYWEVYLAAEDVVDLDNMTGVPIKSDTRQKAWDSLIMTIEKCQRALGGMR